MKIDINKKLLAIDGIHNMNYPFKETEIKDGKEVIVNKTRELTFKDVFIGSLLAPVQQINQNGVQVGDGYETKLEKYNLFVKVRDSGDEIELNTKQIQLLKSAIGKTQPPLILGQVDRILK
jgi:hypothetical protein